MIEKDDLVQRVKEGEEKLKKAVMDNTVHFVDKAKADLATEIPKMLHMTMTVIKTDLDAELNKMQEDTTANVQAKLTQDLPLMEQSLKSKLQTTVASLEVTTVENATYLLQEKLDMVFTTI